MKYYPCKWGSYQAIYEDFIGPLMTPLLKRLFRSYSSKKKTSPPQKTQTQAFLSSHKPKIHSTRNFPKPPLPLSNPQGCPSPPLGGAAEALSRRGASGRAGACAFGRRRHGENIFVREELTDQKWMVDIWQKTCVFCFCFLLLKSEKQTVWVLYSLTALGALWSCTKPCPSHLPGHLDFFGLGLIHLPTGILGLGYIWESQLTSLTATCLVSKVLSFEAWALWVPFFFGG